MVKDYIKTKMNDKSPVSFKEFELKSKIFALLITILLIIVCGTLSYTVLFFEKMRVESYLTFMLSIGFVVGSIYLYLKQNKEYF